MKQPQLLSRHQRHGRLLVRQGKGGLVDRTKCGNGSLRQQVDTTTFITAPPARTGAAEAPVLA
eukprot:753457-Hanusia_phi.AAC.2